MARKFSGLSRNWPQILMVFYWARLPLLSNGFQVGRSSVPENVFMVVCLFLSAMKLLRRRKTILVILVAIWIGGMVYFLIPLRETKVFVLFFNLQVNCSIRNLCFVKFYYWIITITLAFCWLPVKIIIDFKMNRLVY